VADSSTALLVLLAQAMVGTGMILVGCQQKRWN
jgi:hypothetical protein